jgi:hypothetical protein
MRRGGELTCEEGCLLNVVEFGEDIFDVYGCGHVV